MKSSLASLDLEAKTHVQIFLLCSQIMSFRMSPLGQSTKDEQVVRQEHRVRCT
jgi:hypothetical protein